MSKKYKYGFGYSKSKVVFLDDEKEQQTEELFENDLAEQQEEPLENDLAEQQDELFENDLAEQQDELFENDLTDGQEDLLENESSAGQEDPIEEVVSERMPAAVAEANKVLKNEPEDFKQKYKHKYKRKYKKCVRKEKAPVAFSSLYNFDVGGFAVDGALINFTSEGPDHKMDASVQKDTIRVKKDGIYEIIFLMDIMINAASANFGIFKNNTLINEAKFSIMSGDPLQVTAGKIVQLELEKDDKISVRTIDTSTPNVGYGPPAIRYLNASLTAKLLMKD